MPCIAKKYECQREEMEVDGLRDVDYVITTRELSRMIKQANIEFTQLQDDVFDEPMGEATGAGAIFGTTGGVMEAALRAAYEMITGEELKNVEFEAVRGEKGIKKAEIQIGEEETQNLINEEEIGTNTDENNAYLKIMRTNQEGIIPNFNKEIFEYYITTIEDIEKLEITAIPENNNSKVEIIGNDNFVQGENVVQIKVTSQNGQNTNTYKIYITKTNDLEKANTNLETLAVENTFLYPSFDTTITEYKIEVSKDTENLNILAIPEDEKAKVTIEGNTNIKIGDNPILINVLAEDGVTYRKYKIIAHKRNEKEEQQYEEQEKIEAEELAVILNEKGLEEVVEQNTNENTDNISKTRKNISIIIISFIVIILVIILGIIIKRKINTKKPPI